MTPERVLNALEKIATLVKKQLFVALEKTHQGWIVTVIIGVVRVRASLETFMRSPMIVINAVEDEIIKASNEGLL